MGATPPNDQGVGETVTENDDGTFTLKGVCAKGGGDTFTSDGNVVDVRIISGSDPTVKVNGSELDLSQFRDGSDGTDGSGGSDGLDETTVRAIAREETEARLAELVGRVTDELNRQA